MIPKLRYSDLTPEQKEFITNGCGGKGGLIKPPNFIFKASCHHHDFKFWLGCTLEHFKKANIDFYVMMKEDVADILFSTKDRWYARYVENIKISALKSHYHIWAYSYYQFVNVGGKKYFYFANEQKTLKDLIDEMYKKKQGK